MNNIDDGTQTEINPEEKIPENPASAVPVPQELAQPEALAVGEVPVPAGKPKKRSVFLLVLAVVLAVIVVAGAGGFFGIRIYENNSLQQGKNAASAGNWATAEALFDRALSLESTNLLVNTFQSRMLRGEARFKQEKYDLALEDITDTLAVDPSQVMPYLYRAQIYFKRGNLAGALKDAQAVIDRDASIGLPYAYQAYQAYLKNDLLQAQEKAQAALDRDKTLEMAYRVRGSVLAWQYNFPQAKADLDLALGLEPNDPQALAMRTYVDLEMEKEDSARADVEILAEMAPASPYTLWGQGMIALYNFDFDKSTALMDKAVSLDATRPEFYTWRAYSYSKTSQEKDGLADYEKALKLNPNFVPAIRGKSSYLFGIYEPVDVVAQGNRMIDLAPQNPDGYLLLARYYERLRDWGKMSEYVEKAITAQPEQSIGYKYRGDVYKNKHDFDKAIAEYQNALKINPKLETALVALERVYSTQDKYDEALAALDKVASINPDQLGLFVERAMVYYRQKDNAKAKEQLDQVFKLDESNSSGLMLRSLMGTYTDTPTAIKDASSLINLYPNDPSGYILRSFANVAAKKLTDALADATKAIKLDPNLPMAYTVMAEVDMEDFRVSLAIVNAIKATSLDPWDANTFSLLGQAYLKEDKQDLAIAAFKKAVDIEPNRYPDMYILSTLYYQSGKIEEALALVNLLMADKDKLDINILGSAEKDQNFLKTIPVASEGQRTIKDDTLNYKLTYPVDWLQRPLTDTDITDNIIATWVPLSSQKNTILALSIFTPNGDITGVTSKMIADLLVSKISDNVSPDNIVSVPFQANGIQGTADTITIRGIVIKIYVFVSGHRFAAFNLICKDGDFAKMEGQADKIVQTFLLTR